MLEVSCEFCNRLTVYATTDIRIVGFGIIVSTGGVPSRPGRVELIHSLQWYVCLMVFTARLAFLGSLIPHHFYDPEDYSESALTASSTRKLPQQYYYYYC